MSRQLMLVLLGSFLTISACEKKEEFFQPKTGSDSAKKAVAGTGTAMEDQAKQKRDAFIARVQKDMDELDAKLAELKQKALSLSGEAK